MAEGRMLKKRISFSERVNSLSYEAMLIYTWCIPHTDDVGLIPRSPRKLRAIVAPMWDMGVEPFGIQVESIAKSGLFVPYQHGDQEFYYIIGHAKEQTLKRDRKPHSHILDITEWKQVESIWNQLDPVGNLKEVKGKEVKVSEREGITTLNEKVCGDIAEKYSVSLKAVRGARDGLILHCRKNAKEFADYPAALEDWVRRDIDNKKIAKITRSTPMPNLPEPTPEEKAVTHKKILEIKAKAKIKSI